MTVTETSPRRWEEASPGNVTGEARALTAIGPLQHNFRYLVLRVGFLLRRFVFFFRARKVANLRRLGFIHFARWVLFDELPEAGGKRPIGHTYMFFESNFNGGFDEYIDAFSYVIKSDIADIFGSAYNFPGPIPATAFKDFIRRHDYEAAHFFSAYPSATATDVRAALQLVKELRPLYLLAKRDPFVFAAHWRGLMTWMQGLPDPSDHLPLMKDVFAGWFGDRSKAIGANVHALTILLRVQPGRAEGLRADLDALRGDSPFAEIDGTHFARFVVIDRLAFEGRVQHAPDARGELLLFSAVVDGGAWDGYLGRLAEPRLQPVWAACARDGRLSFEEWLQANQLRPQAFYWHYDATVAEVDRALRCQAKVRDFALRHQYATAPDLCAGFRAEFGDAAP
jgi:hypothetical protein